MDVATRWNGFTAELTTRGRYRHQRVHDVTGNRIPAIDAEYMRTVFAREMDAVLYHNVCDLVTLFDLALCLAAQGENADFASASGQSPQLMGKLPTTRYLLANSRVNASNGHFAAC